MHLSSMRAIACTSLAAFALAACGGGGSSTAIPRESASPIPTATPAATFPTPAAASSMSSFAVGTAATSLTIAAVGGIGTTIALPAESNAANVTVVTTTGSATVSPTTRRRAFVAGALPQGPYYITTSFTPDQTITASGTGSVTYDLGPLLATTAGTSLSAQLALIAAYLSLPGAPLPYVGLLDSSGNFLVLGPIAFNGTTLSATLPALTIVAGTTYQVGLHFGPLTPVVVPTATPTASTAPSPSPSASATVAPTNMPTATSTPTTTPSTAPTASATPSTAPTPTQTPSPIASATPNTTTQTIDAAGHGATDANAFAFGTVGPYSASIGYPANNSNVVSATTTAYQGLAPGAPAPSSGSVVYSVTTSLSGGPPSNQSSITFMTANNQTVTGFLNVPTSATGTYSINAYVPSFYGNTPIYSASGLTPSNGQLTFSSPFSAGSSVTLPTNTTIYFELTH